MQYLLAAEMAHEDACFLTACFRTHFRYVAYTNTYGYCRDTNEPSAL